MWKVSRLWLLLVLLLGKISYAQTQGEKPVDAVGEFFWGDVRYAREQLALASEVGESDIDSAILIARELEDFIGRYYYDDSTAITIFRLLDRLYMKKGMYDSCIYYTRAVISYDNYWKSNPIGLANAYCLFAAPFLYKGMYDSMAHYAYKAERLVAAQVISTHDDVQHAVNIYATLASLWMEMESEELFTYYAEKTLRIARTFELDASYPMRMIQIQLCFSRKQWDSAYHYVNEARKTTNDGHLNRMLTGCEIEILMKSEAYDSAIVKLQQLIREAEFFGDEPIWGESMLHLGKVYHVRGEYRRSEQVLRKVLRSLGSEKLGYYSSLINEAYACLADIYARWGRFNDAYEFQQKSIKLQDSLQRDSYLKNMYLAETRARTAEKDKKIAEDQRLIQAQQFEVRQKNMWIGLISGGALLLIGILGSLYSVNRHKQQLQAKKIQIMQQEQEILQLMALMKGEEQERTRLARELHDGIGGMLAAIKMNFSTLRNQCEPLLREYNAPLRPGSFQNIMDLISEASVEVRETAHNLAPNSLIQYGLVEALKLYVEKINNSDQLFIKLEAEQDIKGLDESVQLNLYRIIQELVQNIIKHSGASNALIQLVRSGDMLYISVRDNGKGLSSTDQPGAGLHNARLRVKALHGEIDIESTKGHGLFVRMSFNLEHLTNPSYEHPGSHSG